MMKIQEIPIELIHTNPSQPRRHFDENSIYELAQSIQESGLIQPIIVRVGAEGFYLVAGERRYRAFQYLGRRSIPALVIEASENDSENLSLIENIQRMDLSAIEEALAYQSLLANQKMTQEELARRIGKSQSSIANKLRLLQLTPEVIAAISAKQITERHGRSLLALDEHKQREMLSKIVTNDLNVAQTEKLVESYKERRPLLRRTVVAKDSRIQLAVNTVNEAISSIRNVGIPINSEEAEYDNYYQIVIRLKK